MPTPSSDVRTVFSSIDTELSLSTFNKRWVAAKTHAPSLTLYQFCSDVSNLSRRRGKNREFVLTVAGSRVSVSAACRTMYGTPDAMKDVLKRYLMQHPGETNFASFSELQSRLKRIGSMTNAQINPIATEDNHYPNAARLFESINPKPDISYRTFIGRIQHELKRRGTPVSDQLSIDGEMLLALIERRSRKLPLTEFIERVKRHCAMFRSTLVDERGEPIAPKNAYSGYSRNVSLLYFRCNSNACREPAERSSNNTYVKAFYRLCEQGCPNCSERSRREKRRIPNSTVLRWISDHPIGLSYISGLEEYVDARYSRVLVSCCDAGHEFSVPVGELRPKSGRLYACPNCVKRMGETLSVAIAAYLLGFDVGDLQRFREQTPPWLKKEEVGSDDDLRHDGLFRDILPDGLAIAIEHDGAHHNNPEAASWKIDPETIEKQKRYDKHKRDAQSRWPYILVTVPDLALSTKNSVEAANFVCACMIEAAPSVTAVPGFNERACQLSDRDVVLDLLRQAGIGLNKVKQLRTELEKEQSNIEIRRFDPVKSIFTLFCPAHDREWDVHSRAALPSRDGSRKGTRCSKCAVEARAAERRLRESDLDAIGSRHGFVRAFPFSDYKNNQQKLPWVDAVSGRPVQLVSVMTLQKRERRAMR